MSRRLRSQTRSRSTTGTIFLVLSGLSLVVFAVNATLYDVHPGTLFGMSYGIGATVFMVGAALYGGRRRAMSFASKVGLGKTRTWLDFHLYGGGLFLLLVLMHSGFRLPVGGLNWGVWILSLWTVASGLVGLALQRWIPRVLASGLSIEVNYDRIEELTEEIRQRAGELAARCDDSIRSLYDKTVEPALRKPERRLIFFLDPTGGIQAALKPFRYLEGRLPADEKEKLHELEQLYRTKLELDAHFTLQRALRGWIYAHAPISMLLLALVALHIFTVLYY